VYSFVVSAAPAAWCGGTGLPAREARENGSRTWEDLA
jgi:hypothetical protein